MYHNPKYGIVGDINKFYDKVKKYGFTKQQVKEIIDNTELHQITNERYKPHYYPIVASSSGSYQCDLMFYKDYKHINRGYWIILTCIEITTRKGYLYPMKNKNDVEDGLLKFINEVKPITLTTDNGSEFINKKIKEELDLRNIKHYLADVADHNKMGIVERFNRTIKKYFTRLFEVKGNYNWIDIIDNYNNTIHSTTGKAPNKMSDNDADKLRDRLRKQLIDMRNNQDMEIGDVVRIYNKKGKLSKEGVKFSRDIYHIDGINGMSYVINGKRVKHYDLIGAVKAIKRYNDMKQYKDRLAKERRNEGKHKREGIDEVNIISRKRERRKKEIVDV